MRSARTGLAIDSAEEVRSTPQGSSSSSYSPRPAVRMTRESVFGDFDEDEDADDGGRRSRDEAVTGYSRLGAESKDKAKKVKRAAYVIAPQRDVNWMEEHKRRIGLDKYRKELGSLSTMPGSGDRRGKTKNGDEAHVDRIGDEAAKSGLEVRRKEDDGRIDEGASTPPTSQVGRSPSPVLSSTVDIVDDDERARRALLSGRSEKGGASVGQRVIAMQVDGSEEDGFHRDIDTRPDAPGLQEYAAMPVDEFGAALLRGMGWKEGMGAGRQRQGPSTAPEVKKRAALLGLGAKERASSSTTEQSFTSSRTDRGAKSSSYRRPERRYVPVVRRDTDDNRSRSPPTHRRERDERGHRHRSSDDRSRTYDDRYDDRRSNRDRRHYDASDGRDYNDRRRDDSYHRSRRDDDRYHRKVSDTERRSYHS